MHRKKGICCASCVTFQYRDDKRTHIPQKAGQRRWMDRGLGDTYRGIYESCQATATCDLKKNVAARTLVISPEIDYMQALPPERRVAVLAELTEATVERWFEAMNLPTAEHSYVIHRAQTAEKRADGQAKDVSVKREFLHSHVVLAATVPGFEQDREKYWVGKRQIPQLHRAARQEMRRIWTRELGQERLQQLDLDYERKIERLQQLDDARQQQRLQRQMPASRTIDDALDELFDDLNLPRPERPPQTQPLDIDRTYDRDR